MIDHIRIIETLLFASPEPLTEKNVRNCLNDNSLCLNELVKELNEEYLSQGKGIYIEKIAGGYQILTKSKYNKYIQKLYNKKKKYQLSTQSLEALAIIAYKQPISKINVEYIRGVNCDSVIKSLLEKELITIKGRDSGIGRALLYSTTQKFLEVFGIHELTDLPSLKEIEEFTKEEVKPTKSLNEVE